MTDGFLIARCANCARDALLHYDLRADELVTRCVHCDLVVETTDARTATAEELVALGYSIPGAEPAHGTRGCRDGQCGVQQPDR